MEDNELGFEAPVNFIDHQRYQPTHEEKAFMADIPQVMFTVTLNCLPRNPTFDPLTPFYFFKTGRLPKWLVKWFVDKQKPRLSNMSKFYKAMHCIEALRCYCHDVIQEEEMTKRIDSWFEDEDKEASPSSSGPLKVKLTKGKGLGKKSKK